MKDVSFEGVISQLLFRFPQAAVGVSLGLSALQRLNPFDFHYHPLPSPIGAVKQTKYIHPTRHLTTSRSANYRRNNTHDKSLHTRTEIHTNCQPAGRAARGYVTVHSTIFLEKMMVAQLIVTFAKFIWRKTTLKKRPGCDLQTEAG